MRTIDFFNMHQSKKLRVSAHLCDCIPKKDLNCHVYCKNLRVHLQNTTTNKFSTKQTFWKLYCEIRCASIRFAHLIHGYMRCLKLLFTYAESGVLCKTIRTWDDNLIIFWFEDNWKCSNYFFKFLDITFNFDKWSLQVRAAIVYIIFCKYFIEFIKVPLEIYSQKIQLTSLAHPLCT